MVFGQYVSTVVFGESGHADGNDELAPAAARELCRAIWNGQREFDWISFIWPSSVH